MPIFPRLEAAGLPVRLAMGIVLGMALGYGGAISAQAQGTRQQGASTYGSGMMGGNGGGMMGGGGAGMMGGGGGYGREAAPTGRSAPGWNRLTSYIHDRNLTCMSCHEVSARKIGPTFSDIARRVAGQPTAQAELAQAISNGVSGRWPGYPPMPGGLATPEQARTLARLILQAQR